MFCPSLDACRCIVLLQTESEKRHPCYKFTTEVKNMSKKRK